MQDPHFWICVSSIAKQSGCPTVQPNCRNVVKAFRERASRSSHTLIYSKSFKRPACSPFAGKRRYFLQTDPSFKTSQYKDYSPKTVVCVRVDFEFSANCRKKSLTRRRKWFTTSAGVSLEFAVNCRDGFFTRFQGNSVFYAMSILKKLASFTLWVMIYRIAPKCELFTYLYLVILDSGRVVNYHVRVRRRLFATFLKKLFNNAS